LCRRFVALSITNQRARSSFVQGHHHPHQTRGSGITLRRMVDARFAKVPDPRRCLFKRCRFVSGCDHHIEEDKPSETAFWIRDLIEAHQGLACTVQISPGRKHEAKTFGIVGGDHLFGEQAV
jgi:hypothetical protein